MSDVLNLDLSWIRGKTPNWGRTIAEVELIAAEIMAAEDSGGDLDWNIEFIKRAGQEPHEGDCGQCRKWLIAPVTCDACVYDEYMLKAWEKKRASIEAANEMSRSLGVGQG